ncbi:hypothetical protein QAD02_023559 [Eretmocerus hayati]|uniref:Uncharacterized protein n=1 Tax=Eretmocerus hayati TaxID=131215 RepID=A0ACC2Q136_9HYME|nr:hypothetical protein QAD02_023559 [Eretmocerus hayati]
MILKNLTRRIQNPQFLLLQLRNATAVFIMNLSISDLMFCCFNLPLATSTFWHGAWLHGPLLCRLFPLLRYGLVAVSLFTVLAITINRYVMIGHPRLYPKLYKPRYLALMVLATWIGGFGALIPTWFGRWGQFGLDPVIGSCSILPDDRGRSPKEFLFILAFLAPCCAIVICYARIFYIVRKTAIKSRRRDEASRELVRSNFELSLGLQGIKKGSKSAEDSAIGSMSCQATHSSENGGLQVVGVNINGSSSPREMSVAKCEPEESNNGDFVESKNDQEVPQPLPELSTVTRENQQHHQSNYCINSDSDTQPKQPESFHCVTEVLAAQQTPSRFLSPLDAHRYEEAQSDDGASSRSESPSQDHHRRRSSAGSCNSRQRAGSSSPTASLVNQPTTTRTPSTLAREYRFRSIRGARGSGGIIPGTTGISDIAGKMTPKDRKLLKMILVIFSAFLICYLPITISKVFKEAAEWRLLNIAGYILIYLTTCINPVIYVVMSSEYRSAYKNVLLCRSDSSHQNQLGMAAAGLQQGNDETLQKKKSRMRNFSPRNFIGITIRR